MQRFRNKFRSGGKAPDPGRSRVPWDSLLSMQDGTLLLKFRRRGEPHFREFWLTGTMDALRWKSPSKSDADTTCAWPAARPPARARCP